MAIIRFFNRNLAKHTQQYGVAKNMETMREDIERASDLQESMQMINQSITN